MPKQHIKGQPVVGKSFIYNISVLSEQRRVRKGRKLWNKEGTLWDTANK